MLATQAVGLNVALAPIPHLGDPELAVDGELVDPPRGPDDLDCQVGTLGLLGAKDIAFIGLCGPRRRTGVLTL